MDDGAVEGGAAQAAEQQAGEQEAGVCPAGVFLGFAGDVFVLLSLDGVPGLEIYDGVAVVFDLCIAEDEGADEEFVAKPGGEAVDAAEQIGFFFDLAVGGPGGAHLPGALDDWEQLGIWHPLR